MKSFLIKCGEITFALMLCAFLFFVTTKDGVSIKTVDEVSESLTAVCDTEGLKEGDALKLRERFAVEESSVEGFFYLSSDDVMDVRELLLIKLTDGLEKDVIEATVSDYVKDKQNLFESYAPEQYAMLKKHILIYKGGFLFFYVGNDNEKALSVFNSSI